MMFARLTRSGALRLTALPLLMVLLLIVHTRPLLCQGERGYSQLTPSGSVTNYRFAEPNELTIVVNVLGEVRAPGRYEISRKVTLLDLLALAGGWSEQADMADVSVIRSIQGGTRTERRQIRFDLEDPLKVSESALLLEQGDYVVVGRSTTANFQESLAYVSAAAVLLTFVIALTRGGGTQ